MLGTNSNDYLTIKNGGQIEMTNSLSIGQGSPLDNDTLFFDQKTDYMMWDNSLDRFVISDGLEAIGDILTDGSMFVDANANGSGELYFRGTAGSLGYSPVSGFTFNDDLNVTGKVKSTADIEANGNIYIDRDGSNTGSLFFDGTSEELEWVGTFFRLSDDIRVEGNLISENDVFINNGNTDAANLYFNNTVERLTWTGSVFELTDDLEVTGMLSATTDIEANGNIHIDQMAPARLLVF